MLHDPKIENHGRITRGGKTTKSPSNSHVVERAVRIGERQRSQRRGKRESTASGQLPLRPLPKEKENRERAPDESLEAPPPLALDLDRAGGEEAPPQTKHQVHPETPPALLRGGKKKKKKTQEAKLPKKFPRGEVGGAEGTEPEGQEDVLRNVSTLLHKKFPLSRRPKSTNVTKPVTGANITPTPSTRGVGVSIDK